MQRVHKVINHLSAQRNMAASTSSVKRAFSSLVSPDSGVVIEKRNNNYLVTLNRPKALNALNTSMIEALTPFYRSVIENGEPSVIVMKGEGGKAFCSGGDVRNLYDMRQEGHSVHDILQFFRIEYELNQIIGTLPDHVTQISLLNGITMGGGVGLSVHGEYRVATENTMFAMPETALGFFPDVGGSYFLPRLPLPGVGMWLALTGARLKSCEVYHSGVATHYVQAEKFLDLENALLDITDDRQIALVLHNFHEASKQEDSKIPCEEVEEHFHNKTPEEIRDSLALSPWGQKQLGLLSKMSPLAVKVTHRQINEGLKLSFPTVFEMELDMCHEFMSGTEFYEGVRSVLVDKDRNPNWKHKTLEEVSQEEVAAYFPRMREFIQSRN